MHKLKPITPSSVFAYRMRHTAMEVLVALCLAFLVWLYTRSRDQEILDQVPIPVVIQLAPAHASHYDLEVNGNTRISVSFTGPPSRVRELRRKLHRGLVQVSISLSVPDDKQNESSYRDTVRIEAADVPVPPGVIAVVAEEGTVIPYTVHRLVERHLPVRLDYAGETRIAQIKLEPPTVVVRGPKGILDRLWSISTQPYVLPSSLDAAAANNTIHGQISLINEMDGRLLQTTPKSVAFSFKIRPRQKVYDLAAVPVTFLCPANFPWRPRFAQDQSGTVALRVQGPAGEEPPPVVAFVDLTGGSFGRGRNLEPVRLQLPKEFQLAQESPPMVSFFLEPIGTGAAADRRDGRHP
jgi:hypothetical protein